MIWRVPLRVNGDEAQASVRVGALRPPGGGRAHGAASRPRPSKKMDDRSRPKSVFVYPLAAVAS